MLASVIMTTGLSSLHTLSVAGNSLDTDGVVQLLRGLPEGLSRLNLSGTCDHSIVPALQQAGGVFARVSSYKGSCQSFVPRHPLSLDA